MPLAMRSTITALALLAAVPLAAPAQTEWQSSGTLAAPQYLYSFLASTPQGHLLATTINSSAQDAPPRAIPALLILNPTSARPEVRELLSLEFDPQRGYSGIACNADSTFFISGDTGDSATSFIRKFRPDGTPETTFADGGVLKPGRRCLGMDVIGNQLLAAVDWGKIFVYDINTGKELGRLPAATGPNTFFLRDIAIDPRSLRVFGVAGGGLITWGGGTPWEPTKYSFRELAPKTTEPRSGEGISIDPFKRTVLITPIPGNQLIEVYGTGQIKRYTVSTADTDAHLADSVMSFDGRTLFISDMRGRKIHLMTRTADQLETVMAAVRPTMPAATSTTGPTPFVNTSPTATAAAATPTDWHDSYETVLQEAREKGRPMLVYFKAKGAKPSEDFEKNVLGQTDFMARSSRFINVMEDVSVNRRTAARFGVLRVPTVVLLNSQGESIAEFRGTIPASELFSAMDLVPGG